jgi:phosphate transport system permease protein
VSATDAIAAHPGLTPPPGAPRIARRRESISSWPLADRIAYGACWAVGVGLCLVTVWIVGYMLVKGISYLSLHFLFERPSAEPRQSASGGILDPIEGSLLLTAVGTAIAAPVGVAIAVWLSEYQRPSWFARTVESSVEMIAGAPSVLLAFFGLVLFARPALAFLSQTSAGGAVYGKSFLTAGTIMSLIALPLVVGGTREAIMQIPAHVREASYALGKTKATTIRKVLLPQLRSSIASSVTLGMGRIIGDTAIVVILLGAGLRTEGAGGAPLLSTLRGTGGTLTSYVLYYSPAGEGNQYQKAYAAAFVLLAMVLALNVLALRFNTSAGGGNRGRWQRLIASVAGGVRWNR